MTRTITIKIKDIYGVQTVYPVCDDAKRFAEIAGTKTLTHRTLCQIEALGFEIVQAPVAYRRVA